MAEERSIYQPIKDPDTQQEVLTIFATDGAPRTKSEFTAAFSEYSDTLKAPKGFAVMEPGMLASMRKSFEAVNQPVQKHLPGAMGAIAERAVQANPLSNAIGVTAEKLGLVKPETRAAVPQQAAQVGQGTGQFLAESVNTPEKAGGVLGGLAAVPFTGGASLPLQMLRAGGASAAGRMIGSSSTGSGIEPGKALVEGMIAAGAQGFSGAMRALIGGSMSQQAQQKVAAGIVDMVKTKYPHLIGRSEALDAIASTKGGVTDIIQMALGGLKTDFKSAIDDVLVTVNSRAPHTLSRTTSHQIRTNLDKFYKSAAEYIDNTGSDVNIAKSASVSMRKAEENIATALNDAYGKSPQTVEAIMESIRSSLGSKISNMKQYEALIQALKRSTNEKGFTVQAFQKEVQGYFKSRPGSMLHEAGRLAGRGTDIADTGIDRTVIPSKRFNVPYTGGKLGFSTPPMGKKYVGQVQAPEPNYLGQITGRAAIQSFIGKRD